MLANHPSTEKFPPIVCRVVRTIASPVPALPGDALTVWPGHATHTLCVLSPEMDKVRCRKAVSVEAAYAFALEQYLEGSVNLPLDSERALLSGGLPTERAVEDWQ